MTTGLLLSGGLDSIALAWWKRPNVCFTVNYGQLAAESEVQASRAFCEHVGLAHEVIESDVHLLGSGDMSGEAPDPRAPASDWWPFRNQLLITLAAMRGISRGCQRLLVGAVKSDGDHRDGQHEFFRLMDELMVFQEGALRIKAPAIGMSTTELIRKAEIPRSVLSWSHSCHKANVPCGSCRGCNKHFAVLEELGFVEG